MKISFFIKITLLFAFFSFVPLIILGITVSNNFTKVKRVSISVLENGADKLVAESSRSLSELGENIIKNQAIAVKKLVEQYIKTHPEKTANDLINDSEFQAIAIQPVGVQGYTTVIQTKNQNMIAHPNPKMMGVDLLNMKDKPEMKEWWQVVQTTWRDNVDNYGYYQWPESDGSFSKKYMYLAVIDSKLEGSIDLSVAATTYIEEFHMPVKFLKEQISATGIMMSQNLDSATKNIQYKFYILLLTMSIIVIILGILFASSITKPIKELKNFSKNIAEGKFGESKVKINSKDEFYDLGNCFNKMAKDLNNYKKEVEENKKEMENRVMARTAELQKKNSELETFNKIAVNREMKMVELKNKIKELTNGKG